VNEQERQERIAALGRERAGLVMRGLEDRVAQVDAELARLGAAKAPPRRTAKKK
jgi:hypothetical protein